MEKFEANAIKIADYLENRMSATEEEAFMQELENDEALRNQYEDELAIHAAFSNEENDTDIFFQSADEHINMIEAALEKEAPQKSNTPVFKLSKSYQMVAAIIILVVATAIILMLVKQPGSTRNNIATGPAHKDILIKKDTLAKKDSGAAKQLLPNEQIAKNEKTKDTSVKIDTVKKNQPSLLANNKIADSIFNKFYTLYSAGENDPAELKGYYADYKKANYPEVLSATDADYQLMGADDRNELLKQYMSLYKGLSYLAKNNTANAIKNFDAIIAKADKHEPVYYSAEWYSALTYLKENNLSESGSILNNIRQSASPYKNKAEQISEELKTY